jgi:hypothetical protein
MQLVVRHEVEEMLVENRTCTNLDTIGLMATRMGLTKPAELTPTSLIVADQINELNCKRKDVNRIRNRRITDGPNQSVTKKQTSRTFSKR